MKKSVLYINGISLEYTRDFEVAKAWGGEDEKILYSAWNPEGKVSVIFFGNIEAALEFVRANYKSGYTDVWGIARDVLV